MANARSTFVLILSQPKILHDINTTEVLFPFHWQTYPSQCFLERHTIYSLFPLTWQVIVNMFMWCVASINDVDVGMRTDGWSVVFGFVLLTVSCFACSFVVDTPSLPVLEDVYFNYFITVKYLYFNSQKHPKFAC